MAEEDDWKKLPIEEKVTHKVWKARVAGYEEAAKRFRLIDDEKSSEYNNFLSLMKKFVLDTNAVAQEKGLEATFSFVENAACATKCCSEVVAGIVAKVLNARPKSKALGINICLMYVEIEKQDVVIEELINGFTNKQPKIVAGSVLTVCTALREFGGKVIMMKNLVKSIPALLSHSDKTVRAETKQLAIEIFKWIRDAIKPQLTNIKPVQLKELEEEWEKVDPTPPVPTRFTRSQQKKMAEAPPPAAQTGGSAEVDGPAAGGGGAPAVAIDPWDMFDPVEILSKLPKNFYEQIESKKWQERMESLEELHKLASNPKLEPGQYGEVCAVLKKIITKDSNINVVALAAKCVTGLATGLRKKFQTYSGLLIPAILGKFKEKKLNVVVSLRDAIDAVFASTNLNSIMEDVVAHLDNKNPSIKDETCKFLTRVFSTATPATVPKGVLKTLAPVLVKKLDDTVGPVRDSAAECLGTALKALGERAMAAHLEGLDKIKQDKVKEYCEKAEITAAPGGGGAPSATASAAAPAKAAAPEKKAGPPTKKGPPKKGPPKKAADGGDSAKPAAKKPTSGGGKPKAKAGGGKKEKKKKKKGDDFAADQEDPREPEIAEGTVDAKAEELFGEERLKQLASANWKERLEAVDEMTKKVETLGDDLPTQVIIRTLAKKPGWKDSNFQALGAKFKLCGLVASKSRDFSRRSAWYAIAGLISKIGDIKLKTQVKETLKVFAENISLNYISLKVAKSAEEAKNPKLHTESLNWMGDALKEFGYRIDLKPHIAFIKTSLTHTNPGVRKSAIEFLATLYIYVGPPIRMFFEEEKAALLQQIDSEFEKVKDEKPPAPIRRFIDDVEEENSVEDADGGDEGGEDGGADGGGVVNMDDLVDRVNISDKLTDAVLNKITDKNWKIRKEGLEEVQGFINEAKFITPDISELPAGLKARLSDNNKVLVTMAINISKQLAEAGGSGMARHKNTMLPGIIGTFSDAKPHLRKAGEEALDMWHSKIGFLPLLDNEILSTAMKEANPNLRATLLTWLSKVLPNEKKLPGDFKDCIAPLFSCIEDRNGAVRDAAKASVQHFMAHLGYEAMSKATAKLDPTSKKSIQDILEKAREVCVPIAAPGKKGGAKGGASKSAGAAQAAKSAAMAAQAAAAAAEVSKEPAAPKKAAGKKEESSKPAKAEGRKTSKAVGSSSRSKKNAVVEDDGPPIIHKVGKNQRMKEEKALKVLKWNFSVPRDEIVEQLKEQIQPCVSPSMHTKLFHKDFKFHLEAIDILTKSIETYTDAMLESLDLLLKWVTLRFFDTNTSVLLKALDFIAHLFSMLGDRDYQLSPFEAQAFMPYLVGKIGDPKDNVRKSVRGIVKQSTKLYPASKIFSYLMEGLQSKNVKSRMECCEELGFLINKCGIEVCQPSLKVLKDIAAQIADRDNGVRSAALNCIVAAYNIVGDTVYKYIGRLAEKESSYLEERIKRSGNKKAEKEKPVEKAAPVAARGARGAKPGKAAKEPVVAKSVDASDGGSVPPKPDLAALRAMVRAQTAPAIKREFELDFKAIEGDEDTITGSIPTLKSVNISAVMEAANIPTNLRQAYDTNKQSTTVHSSVKDIAELLDLTIAKISSADIQVAMENLLQIEDVFKKKKMDEPILKRIDQYLVTALVQLKMLFSRHMENKENSSENLERLLKLLLSGLLALFDTHFYARVVSKNVLKDVILFFITTLNDKSLEKFEGSELSVQIVNRLLLRVITNSNKTHCLGACIKLLQELSENSNTSPALLKLVMKCMWKLTHLLPDFISEVNLEAVLLDIHTFYKILPTAFWKAKEDRGPQQTVKALLSTLCKLRSSQLLECLKAIEDPNASDVPSFIQRHCGRPKTTGGNPTTTHTAAQPSVTKSVEVAPISVGGPTNEALVEIFRKIGSKEQSRAGILELYHFKKKYPDMNVEPFIKNASPFFQSFIERSLNQIGLDEGKAPGDNIGPTPVPSSLPTSQSEPSNLQMSESAKYMDRLKMLKEQFKNKSQLPPSSSSQPEQSLPSSMTSHEAKDPSPEPKEESMPEVSQQSQEKKNFDLDDIKRRLQLIKGGQK